MRDRLQARPEGAKFIGPLGSDPGQKRAMFIGPLQSVPSLIYRGLRRDEVSIHNIFKMLIVILQCTTVAHAAAQLTKRTAHTRALRMRK